MTAAEFAARLEAKPTGWGKWEARCPAHDDRKASLCVGTGERGRVLLYCQAGCETPAVVAAAGLRMGDLAPERLQRPGKLGGIVASYSYANEAGAELFQVVRFEPKEFRQRHRAGPGQKANREGWCWKRGSVRAIVYRLPQVRAAVERGATIYVVEGEKDVEALELIGLTAATCNAGGAGKWRQEHTECLAGAKRVVILADKDEPGRKHAVAVAKSLRNAGIAASVVEVPRGKDAADWIGAGATRDDFEKLAGDADDPDLPPELEAEALAALDGSPEPPPHEDDDAPGQRGKPEIKIGPDEDRVVREAIDAISNDPDLFQRGASLVQISYEPPTSKALIARDATAPRIVAVPEAWIRTRLAGEADFRAFNPNPKPGESQWKRAHPPQWAVKSVATAGAWPRVRVLQAVVETPILRADGSVLDVPGFDPSTGLLYLPIGPAPKIPAHPTRDDALAARDRLLAVVGDFPFERPEHRSAWLAFLLTMPCRWAFDGPAPLFLVDANVRAAGKGMLVKATVLLATGRMPPTMTLPAEEDERRKRITASAIAGDSIALIDNIEGVLGGATLNAALTSTTWADRILGLSANTGTLPLFMIWVATGNNMSLGADTTRRTIHIRLQSEEEKPEEREGFSHPDLLGWIRAERHRLLADALTICRAYFEAGRPDMKLKSMGSFEGWALIRQIVVWTGLPDPLSTQLSLAETSDREAALFKGLLTGLEAAIASAPEKNKATSMTAKDLIAFAGRPEGEALKDVLLEHLPGKKDDLPTTARLAGKLRHFRGRVSGGKMIDHEDGSSNTGRWLVRAPKAGGVGELGEFIQPMHAGARARGDSVTTEITPQTPQVPDSDYVEEAVE